MVRPDIWRCRLPPGCVRVACIQSSLAVAYWICVSQCTVLDGIPSATEVPSAVLSADKSICRAALHLLCWIFSLKEQDIVCKQTYI